MSLDLASFAVGGGLAVSAILLGLGLGHALARAGDLYRRRAVHRLARDAQSDPASAGADATPAPRSLMTPADF
jgi:hypothetical protein